MLQSLKRDVETGDEAESLSSTLQMALSVRLRIFAVEKIKPAADEFLVEFSQRLDQVRARRHAVDFEAAKSRAWWKGPRTTELVDMGRRALATDPEIQRLKAADGIEPIVFDRYAGEALQQLVRERFADIELQMASLRDNRLNVQ